MTLYYLPCSCGKKIEVDAGQAGLSVRCQCGADLTVPTMRGLKQLEPVEAPSEVVAAETQQANWGARQGVVFLGLVVLLGACCRDCSPGTTIRSGPSCFAPISRS